MIWEQRKRMRYEDYADKGWPYNPTDFGLLGKVDSKPNVFESDGAY